MKLTLHKPLCVFDLETTGVQITKDRIVQIAIIKIHPDGSELEYNQIVNPEMEIPQEICEIHAITNEMAKKAPTLKELAPAIMAFIGDADLAGFNSNKFDIPVLVEELIRVGIDADFPIKRLWMCKIFFIKWNKEPFPQLACFIQANLWKMHIMLFLIPELLGKY